MIKYIFTDIDGTILNDEGIITEENSKIIRNSNIPISLVSARAPMEMINTLQKIDANGIHVGFNGGIIYAYQNSVIQIIEEKPINKHDSKYLINYIKTNFPNISQSYYSRNNWYTFKRDRGINYETSITKLQAKLIDMKAYTNPSFSIFKIMLITFDEKEMITLTDKLKKLNMLYTSVQRSGKYYLEITHTEAKKSKAIDYILNYYGINAESAAAFGDGHNDLPMFSKVGYPIAMANASDEVKLQAKYITKSNNQNGVGYGIKYLL